MDFATEKTTKKNKHERKPKNIETISALDISQNEHHTPSRSNLSKINVKLEREQNKKGNIINLEGNGSNTLKHFATIRKKKLKTTKSKQIKK